VGLEHYELRWSGVHASDFNPGSVTFVGGLEPWSMVDGCNLNNDGVRSVTFGVNMEPNIR
jgi:hypothetical protein